VLAVALTAIGIVATFGIWALVSTRSAGNEKAMRIAAEKDRDALATNLKNESARADKQEKRANALDAAIAKEATDAVGPVDGSLVRLLQEAARHRAPDPVVGEIVREPGAASGTAPTLGPDDLLPPGA